LITQQHFKPTPTQKNFCVMATFSDLVLIRKKRFEILIFAIKLEMPKAGAKRVETDLDSLNSYIIS